MSIIWPPFFIIVPITRVLIVDLVRLIVPFTFVAIFCIVVPIPVIAIVVPAVIPVGLHLILIALVQGFAIENISSIMFRAIWRQPEGKLSSILETSIVSLHLKLDVIDSLVGEPGVLEEQVELRHVVHHQASSIMSFIKSSLKLYRVFGQGHLGTAQAEELVQGLCGEVLVLLSKSLTKSVDEVLDAAGDVVLHQLSSDRVMDFINSQSHQRSVTNVHCSVRSRNS